jgi:chromosome segregation ATPase
MSGMRQDTMKHVDMDKSLSNKERFDRLKESRQKYKDEAARQREEARSANEKVELLEKQLQMLVAQVEAGEETKASSEPTQSEKKANGTAHADRIDALTTRVSVLTAELERQKTVAARATNAMHEKTMEASEWRKKCDKAEKIAAAAADKNARGDGFGGVGAVSGDYAAYVYGALLGASAVAIIGYGALSYSMRAAR